MFRGSKMNVTFWVFIGQPGEELELSAWVKSYSSPLPPSADGVLEFGLPSDLMTSSSLVPPALSVATCALIASRLPPEYSQRMPVSPPHAASSSATPKMPNRIVIGNSASVQ